MNKNIITAYLILGFGAIIVTIGVFLVTRYFELEQWCALNRVPCPTFSAYISVGTLSLVLGALLLISEFVVGTRMKEEKSHVVA